MSSNTNQKKWLWPVVFGALAAVVLLAVALNYAVRAERTNISAFTENSFCKLILITVFPVL